ncbi:FkbM family methyltransferase, partial [Halobacterium bonnevillei]|uniref:FkbM family methyltransferase n=1 Tax=Halobacterium bonnevillei TaxID=2692200 RepID=UPI001EFFA20D
DGHISMYDVRTRRVVSVPNMWQLHHGSRENRCRQAGAYTLNYEIDPGDVVVDVGAYLGQFSLYAAETASKVIAIDPYASINDCLQRNVANSPTITVYPVAAWNRDEPLSIQLSHYPSDTSLLEPDILPTGKEVEVPGRTISSICAEAGVDSIDVLKIEAEGVEPEVLEGAPDAKKIIVNCGPERRGEKPTETVVKMLEQRGYDVQVIQTDEAFAPNYGESPGLSDIEMVLAEYDQQSD